MATVTLNRCRPDKDRVTVGPGGGVDYKSGDGHTYFIDMGSNDGTVSDDLPLEVPANGSTATLNVKTSTPDGTYMYAIQNAERQQCWPVVDAGPGDVPPKIIVE